MSRISIRSQSLTCGLPGIGRSKAHDDQRSSTRQTTHKLATLGPLAALNELRSDSGKSVQKAKSLIEKGADAHAAEPAKRRPRVAKVFSQLSGKTAVLLGLKHRKPQPHAQLLRYADTRPGNSERPTPPHEPAALRDVIPALVRTLELEEVSLHAQIDVNHTAGVEAALDSEIHRIREEEGLAILRMANLADRIPRLEQQRNALMALLHRERAAMARMSGLLLAVREHEPAVSDVPRLEQELDGLRRHARQTAVSLHFNRASPTRALHEREITHTNEKIEAMQSELAHARAAPAKRDNSEQLAAARLHQARIHDFEQRLREVETQLMQTRHSSTVNAAHLWEVGDGIADLEVLLPPLQEVMKRNAAVLEETSTRARKSRMELGGESQALLSRLLGHMPGFQTGVATAWSPPALRIWADGLERKVGAFGVDALAASSVLAIGMQALSIASGEDPVEADAILCEMRACSLSDLISAQGGPGAALTGMPGLSEKSRVMLGLLASVPRGMQVVSHLFAPGEMVRSKEQLYAARIYLQADDALRRASPEDGAGRRYLENAKRAVRCALQAPSVALGLAAATVDERAAYHGFRNGYQDNAADSHYQKANQHLRMLADWQHDAASSRRPWQARAHSPYHALREALTLATATGLPTPKRRARDELAKAADCLMDYVSARRQQLPPGQRPTDGELALQALAEQVQRTPIGTDLLTLKFDTAALAAIAERQGELRRHFEQGDVTKAKASPHDGFDAAWRALQATEHTLPEAMSLIQRQLLSPHQAASAFRQLTGEAAHWAKQEAAQRNRFHAAVGKANRLLYDGDLDKRVSGQTFHDLFEDMLAHLEWRDKLRFTEQHARGVNLGPLAAAFAVLGLPLGAKMVLSLQISTERVIEFYMGRTGPYIQIGKQKAHLSQAGAGLNGGCIWSLGKKLRMGMGWSADLRVRRESGIEQGVQLRIPRRAKGQDVAIVTQFLDLFEHLTHLATQADASRTDGDWMRELLAHHPNLNVGLIDRAPRKTIGTESNISVAALLRAACFRAGGTAGLKSRQDASSSSGVVAGNMTTTYRDSTGQNKTDVVARLGASVQSTVHEDKRQLGLSTGFFDLSHGREIRAKGRTHFCTVFTFDDEIDPVRTDRAIDFQSFKEFQQEVRDNWDAWVHYGIPKLASQVDENMRYVVAERQLENFLEQADAFTRINKLATMYVDYTLKPEAAPILDALRAEASLGRKAGREDLVQRAERDFDDLMTEPALWEPAILVLREKTRMQVERGIDLFVKVQRNRLAESQRTVGQWVQYEPVERADPGQRPAPARTWPDGAA
ncbi:MULTISPECIES: hypothetical protein [unclassified Duganella]|uniref:hypothetical protein n=1 Tax=unclassified Duganella TaxID=2636909 RepID=UPI000E3427E4|nr:MULTISPECIES: hypothetical protein [unclassified Duganella]RFP09203.1 hypothetical protein D0T23_26155 [Duganella sp. BJB475]RFP25429.1 hypothetical protein D0T21_28240 [Duganella sp. BJB476]